MIRTTLLLAGVMTVGSSNLFAQTLAEQKICAEAAKVYFKEYIKEYFNEDHAINSNSFTQGIYTYSFFYETHFNTKLGRCLIQLRILLERNDGEFVSRIIRVQDVFERKTYEELFVVFVKSDKRTPEQEKAQKRIDALMSE